MCYIQNIQTLQLLFSSPSPQQMTEQRKNKQRLGFLGPPQPNHHIPTHWALLLAHYKAREKCRHMNCSLENNTCTQMYTYNYWCQNLQGTSKCWCLILDIVPFLWHKVTQTRPYLETVCLLCPLSHKGPCVQKNWSVNDWPGTAHTFQCSDSVPDRSWGKC